MGRQEMMTRARIECGINLVTFASTELALTELLDSLALMVYYVHRRPCTHLSYGTVLRSTPSPRNVIRNCYTYLHVLDQWSLHCLASRPGMRTAIMDHLTG